MHKFRLAFVALTLAIPVGVVFAQTASAAGGTSCSKGSGTATFAPGLFKLQSGAAAETHEATSTIGATGTVSGCSGGGVVSGTTTSTIKIADPTNCNSLLDSKEPPASPATVGTLTVKWNNGKTSTVGAITLTSVPGQSTQANLSGKVTSGTLFKGLTVTARVSFKATTSDQCVTSNLTKVTYTGVTAFKIA